MKALWPSSLGCAHKQRYHSLIRTSLCALRTAMWTARMSYTSSIKITINVKKIRHFNGRPTVRTTKKAKTINQYDFFPLIFLSNE